MFELCDRELPVSRAFEELDRQTTPMGEISLRRRLEPTLKVDVFEVKLGDEFLMSSLFTTGERALAQLGLAAVSGDKLDVVIGGLGLGYTAREALDDERVHTLQVIDALAEVIEWHHRHLVPLGAAITQDPRCHLIHGNFFSMIADGLELEPGQPTRVDAILLDIDHSPRHLLHPSHTTFYEPDGIRQLGRHLRPGGVFALWSNDPPDTDFLTVLRGEFATGEARIVTFPNFYTGIDAESTIYVATSDDEPKAPRHQD